MNRNQLIEVFQDTMRLVEFGNIATMSSTRKHDFQTITNFSKGVGLSQNPVIKTISSDTVSAAEIYSKLGRTCVLNMASAYHAGGGVVNGAKAQEECLFRCSNLYETVVQDFYPLKTTEALYTRDAVFFKDKDYNPITPFKVDVVTVAAVNLNPNAHYDENRDYEIANYNDVMLDKIRLILHLAVENGCENIILGAWGCGVFKNDPEDVSKMFSDVISNQFMHSFKNIIFAVINDHNSAGDNYKTFDKHFNRQNSDTAE
jgi:uncharacterized protein (TIGR02452 family)